MPKNKLKSCIIKTVGETDELKKECAQYVGLTLRRIQALYSNPDLIPSVENIYKLAEFFSMKWGKKVQIDEIVDNRNDDVKKSVKAIINKVNSRV